MLLDELENKDYEVNDTVKAGHYLKISDLLISFNIKDSVTRGYSDVVPDIIFSNTKKTTKLDDNRLSTIESKEDKWNTNQ